MAEPTERDREMARKLLHELDGHFILRAGVHGSDWTFAADVAARALAQAREEGEAGMEEWRRGAMLVLDALADAGVAADRAPEHRIRALAQQRKALRAENANLRALLEQTRHVWELLPLEWEERVCAALEEGT